MIAPRIEVFDTWNKDSGDLFLNVHRYTLKIKIVGLLQQALTAVNDAGSIWETSLECSSKPENKRA